MTHAEPCDAPGYRLYTTAGVEFRAGCRHALAGIRLPLIALKSQLVGEPDHAETLRAVVCVRPAESLYALDFSA